MGRERVAFRDSFLVVGGGPLQVQMIKQVQSSGLQAIVTDSNPEATGMKIADEAIVLDTYDEKGHADLVRQPDYSYRISGVATCGADVAPTVSAAAAQGWQLPHLPYPIAKRTHNKYEVRKALSQAGLDKYQPGWACFAVKGPPWRVLKYKDGVNPEFISRNPYVTKPVSDCASRGVRLCEPNSDMQANLLWSKGANGTQVLMEERLYGKEHSAEVIFDHDGKDIYFNIVDRGFIYLNGKAIETGHINPSVDLSPARWEACRQAVLLAAKALGVNWGPFKCDLMTNEDGVFILECTARLSGGYDCQATTPLATGRNPIGAALSLAYDQWPLPETVMMPPVYKYSACHAIMAKPGTIKRDSRERLDELFRKKHPDKISTVFWSPKLKPGYVVDPYSNCADRIGFVITTSTFASSAWAIADEYARQLAEELKDLMDNGLEPEKSQKKMQRL